MVQKTASASPCLDYHYCKGNCYQKPGPDSVGPPLGGQKFQSDTIPRFPRQCKQERPDVFIPQGMLSRLTWRLHRRFWNTINTIQSELNHSEEFSDFFFFFFFTAKHFITSKHATAKVTKNDSYSNIQLQKVHIKVLLWNLWIITLTNLFWSDGNLAPSFSVNLQNVGDSTVYNTVFLPSHHWLRLSILVQRELDGD